MKFLQLLTAGLGLIGPVLTGAHAAPAKKPHVVFVMADDMGWGQTGYRGHPALKTPHLDAMAANGLRFERFYASAPVCSPTRASVLTGRTNNRSGVLTYGYALRLQEKTIAQAVKSAGYVTGHFGKWHLNGLSGPGVPILATDPRHPGRFGFDEWISVSNFYELDPLMSRNGQIEEFKGDSSEIVVDEAVRFLKQHVLAGKPAFAVVWFGSPHSPYKALPADRAPFHALDESSANHYGELVAMDRSIGTLRRALRDLGIARDTLLVFCSDNGGLPNITPETVGGLRGVKGSVYEGGLRVPGIIEWPGVITPRVTSYPASTSDLFPTVADVLGLPRSVFIEPIDGISLKPLFTGDPGTRAKPMGFRFGTKAALIDHRFKILTDDVKQERFELYDLEADPRETTNLSAAEPQRFERMRKELLAWNASVEASFAGKDYPEGKVVPADPAPRVWHQAPEYAAYVPQWKERWEYQGSTEPRPKAEGKAAKKSAP